MDMKLFTRLEKIGRIRLAQEEIVLKVSTDQIEIRPYESRITNRSYS